VEDLSELFARTFLGSKSDGGLDIHHDIAPQLAEEVYQSCRDAQSQMEVGAPNTIASEFLQHLQSGLLLGQVRWFLQVYESGGGCLPTVQ